MQNKMIKKVFVLMSILPLSACGSTMQESDMIQSAYFCANESGYRCVLRSYEDIAAQASGQTLHECWLAASQQIRNPAAFGLMDSVWIGKGLFYPDVVQIADLLQNEEVRFPALEVYYTENGDISADNYVKGTRFTHVENNNESTILPSTQQNNCVFLQKDQAVRIDGTKAAFAMLLAGESAEFSARVSYHNSEWQVTSACTDWYVQADSAKQALLCVQLCFAKGVDLQTGQSMGNAQCAALEEILGTELKNTLALTGPLPYGIPARLKLQMPGLSPDVQIQCAVHLSKSI
mgnify:FL=1